VTLTTRDLSTIDSFVSLPPTLRTTIVFLTFDRSGDEGGTGGKKEGLLNIG